MSSRTTLVLLVCLSTTTLTCGQNTTPRLPSDVYVWNRTWSAPLRESLDELGPHLGAFRVLVQELGKAPALISLDLDALRRTQRPVIPVMRAGGAMPTVDELDRFAQLAAELRTQRALPVSQIELDYDAPTESLEQWASVLRQFNRRGFRVSITALPAWSQSAHARLVAEAVDQIVLQVHTIRAPTLFDAGQAVRDVRVWASRTARPFVVALPTYRATMKRGEALAGEPAEVARAMRELERISGVAGTEKTLRSPTG